MEIIALTGQVACGKGVVARILKARGYRVIAFSELMAEVAVTQGKKTDRDVLREIADEARRNFGSGIWVEWLIERGESEGVSRLVIDGLRTRGELKMLRKYGGKLMAVEANEEDRLSWYLDRGKASDHLSAEGFEKLQLRENSGVEDWEINIAACMEQAEVRIWNDGTDNLEAAVLEALTELVFAVEGEKKQKEKE